MQLYVQAAMAEKSGGKGVPSYRADVYIGSIFADLIAVFMIIATGATLFVHHIAPDSAYGIAQALRPLAGQYTEIVFALGLYGASALAAAVLPLSTAYAVTESFGWERGMQFGFREAPAFRGLFIGLLVFGAIIAVIPGLPLIQAMIVAQALNGILLPVILVFVLLLVNNRRLMGALVNGRTANVIAVVTVTVVSILSVILIVVSLAGFFGVKVPGSS